LQPKSALELSTGYFRLLGSGFMDFPVVSLADIDLSSQEFWAMPRDWREGAFKTLRDEAPFQFFDEYVMEDSPFPPGRG
jgi:hypothetical protein